MAHKDAADHEAAQEALTAHRIREEAMRRAEMTGAGLSLEAQMALVSARVTAEAQERKTSTGHLDASASASASASAPVTPRRPA